MLWDIRVARLTNDTIYHVTESFRPVGCEKGTGELFETRNVGNVDT